MLLFGEVSVLMQSSQVVKCLKQPFGTFPADISCDASSAYGGDRSFRCRDSPPNGVSLRVAGRGLTNHECMAHKLISCDSRTMYSSEQEGNPRPHVLRTGSSH